MSAHQKFMLEFLPGGKRFEIDPSQSQSKGKNGKPGSLLELALDRGIDIDHSCGGVCACSTCHVIIREGAQFITPATEEEEVMLSNAPGLTPHSRLACQCIPSGGGRIAVEIPSWNRNLVREGK